MFFLPSWFDRSRFSQSSRYYHRLPLGQANHVQMGFVQIVGHPSINNANARLFLNLWTRPRSVKLRPTGEEVGRISNGKRGILFTYRKTSRSLSSPPVWELKERFHGYPQALGHLLQRLEGRGVNSALYQAQEVHGDPHEFGKALLREPALLPYGP